MNLLPQGSGSRPRTACEITPDGVVAGRSGEAAGALSAAARVALPRGAVLPGLKPGNVVDRVAVIAAIRRALEAVGARSNARGSEITLVLPDGAARVLLLDFDALPSKLTEALPIVRFRLKKLLPFEADDAMVSYQVMSSSRNLVRVLAVAMPRDVLAEYETAVREAGFEPGAVLPSTLASLPGVPAETAALFINCNRSGVTTAILRGELLLLHRTVDLQTAPAAFPANLPPALFDGVPGPATGAAGRRAVDEEPYPEQGTIAYVDRRVAEEAVQGQNGASGLEAGNYIFGGDESVDEASRRGPDGSQNAILVTPAFLGEMVGSEAGLAFLAAAATGERVAGEVDEEIAQAVSVAMAYFEDTLASAPSQLWSAGAMPAEELAALLHRHGLLGTADVEVRELVESAAMEGSAISASVPRSALAGVAGALRA